MFARSEFPPLESPAQQQLVMQLQQAMQTMRQLDELFHWLASTLVQRFGVSLTQFWLPADQAAGGVTTQLLAIAALDPSVPERVVAHEEIRWLVERCAAERQPPFIFPLEQAFSAYQANRLNRYGFHVGACAFLEGTVPRVRLKALSSSEESSGLFSVTTLLFFRQLPGNDFWTAIHVLFEQGMLLAAERGLKLSSGVASFPATSPGVPPHSGATSSDTLSHRAQPPGGHRSSTPPQPPTQPDDLPPLEELIPRRRQDPDLLLATNPFTNAGAITDERARRLQAAIDGQGTVSELCRSTGLSLGEAYVALQILLKQQRIEIYDPSGRPIKASLFFKGY